MLDELAPPPLGQPVPDQHRHHRGEHQPHPQHHIRQLPNLAVKERRRRRDTDGPCAAGDIDPVCAGREGRRLRCLRGVPSEFVTRTFRRQAVEALVDGPIDADNLDEFWNQRAHFILTEHGDDEIEYHEKVADELNTLTELTANDEVNLWFEYELFCSVNMWFCLSLLEATNATVYRVEPSRARVLESTVAGRKEISGGRFVNGGETPWMNKCETIATPAPAKTTAADSVKALFEKHDLLGNLAWDCSKPASKSNLRYVHRALDGDRVQREQLSGPTGRDWVVVIDKASEARPNEIAVSGTSTGRAGSRDLDRPTNGV